VTVFAEQGIDLRDPKLSITPENQLMLLLGGSVYSEEGNYISKQPKIAFSLDGSKKIIHRLKMRDGLSRSYESLLGMLVKDAEGSASFCLSYASS